MKAYYLSLVKTDTGEGGGGVLRISSDGDDGRILWVWKFRFRDFLGVGEFGKYFFWVAWFVVGIFSGIKNNLKVRDSNHGIYHGSEASLRINTNKLARKFGMAFFWVSFWSRYFFGFCWKPWGILGFWICPHSITDPRHLKSWIPPGNR